MSSKPSSQPGWDYCAHFTRGKLRLGGECGPSSSGSLHEGVVGEEKLFPRGFQDLKQSKQAAIWQW